MTELILNSNEHKIDSNKLRYEFKSPIRFNNSFMSLTQAIFYNFFHNAKESYQMKVKKDNTFYEISFIDSMLEVHDINKTCFIYCSYTMYVHCTIYIVQCI